MRFFLALICFLVPLHVSAFNDYARVTDNGHGTVASVNPLATQVGLDVFAKGGNAIDAAAAVAFALGVVDSHNSGIGGGCFVLIHQADGTLLAIDGREMAPAKAHRDMFVRDGKAMPEWSRTGALASGVPGAVAALFEAQQTAGKLSFSDVLLPAADIAEQGFAIDAVAAKRLQRSADILAKFPASAAIFLDADGNAFLAGATLVQKDLAHTYRQLAKHGPRYFYQGKFSKTVAKWMSENGGLVTAKDFARYHTKIRQPVRTRYLGYEVVGFPPPSSGGVIVAEILNILENFDLAKMTAAERYHVMIEAMKLAFADRAYWLGDSDYTPVPKGLISKQYAKTLAAKISLEKATDISGHSIPENASTDLFGKHTTHIATADKDGNWVAITTTLNTSYGSKVVIPGTGVLMNNQMDDFSVQPGVPNAFGLVGAEANSVQAHKRPLSSMSPSIVLQDGKPILTAGAAGGPTIITQVLQALVNVMALDMNAMDAVAAARVHQQWRPSGVLIDAYAEESLKQALQQKGHELRAWPPFGATQAIGLQDGAFMPVTEPRLISGNR